jgi:glucose-1-phosphate cytidylyltransferase
MKVVILAWGLWTRLSEETTIKPKPMVEIGWKPILWHIMKIYSHYWYKDFIIALWYKWYYIKEWYANYFLHNSDVTFDLKNNQMVVHNNNSEDWKVTLVDTWDDTMTGWRIKRVIDWWYITEDEFMMTYWDWVSDVNIKELVEFHKNNWKLATITAVRPEWRFWWLKLENNKVTKFLEKKDNINTWINAWFMILNKNIVNLIDWYNTPLENKPLESLAESWELMSYKHRWFWFAMDTLKNRQDLEILWNKWNAPWKVW